MSEQITGGNFLKSDNIGSEPVEAVVKGYGIGDILIDGDYFEYYYLILDVDGEEYLYRMRPADFERLIEETMYIEDLIGKTVVIKPFLFKELKLLRIIDVKKDEEVSKNDRQGEEK